LGELVQLLEQGEDGQTCLELDASEALRVEGDPDQLRQAFLNLMLNALQAGGEHAVRVRVQPAGPVRSGLAFTIEDRGCGIPPADLERMFEPFFTTKAKGTGLGLATVHRVIEAHGGSVEVASEVDEGTRIRVWLPADQTS
jgi:signal transduction histidine kinase